MDEQKEIAQLVPVWRKVLLKADEILAKVGEVASRPYRYLMDNVMTNTSVMVEAEKNYKQPEPPQVEVTVDMSQLMTDAEKLAMFTQRQIEANSNRTI